MKVVNSFLVVLSIALLTVSCAKDELVVSNSNDEVSMMTVQENAVEQSINAKKGPKCLATVSATFNADCVDVASNKDLSNVVIATASGELKFDNLNQGHTGTFCSPNGEVITSVWIKSGCNKSNDGPGYGERIDAVTDGGGDDF